MWSYLPTSGTKLVAVHGFFWDPTSGGRLVGQLAGDAGSEATDVNDAGQVVGSSGTLNNVVLHYYRGREDFLWQNGAMSDLGVGSSATDLGSGLSDVSINNNGLA